MGGARIGLVCFLGLAACIEEPISPLDSGNSPPAVDSMPDMAVAPLINGPALKIRVRSSDDLEPLPSRLIITGVAPTVTPEFHKDGGTAQIYAPEVLAIPDGVLLVTGEAVLPLPAGTYDLLILQGPEYEQLKRRITVGNTEVVALDEVLEHSVRTTGWLAADMHIHTSISFDSKLLPVHRVIAEVAGGVELLVPAEHIWHYDFQPYIDALGYTSRAASIPGSEYGFKYGHLGIYPIEYDPKGPLLGAPEWERWENWGNLTPDVAFPMMHALPGQPMIIINHPRLLPDLGYFTNIGWPHSPSEPLDSAGNFDGIEVLNGYQTAPEEINALFRDWFFLLSQGYRTAGLGNSDSHRIDWLASGYPRTWLRFATEDPTLLIPSDLRTAILGMRAIASTGPWVKLTVDGHEIGDTFTPKTSDVTVEIEADAATWIDLSTVQLYQDGILVKEWSIADTNPGRSHPALRVSTSLTISKDSFLVAMAVGDRSMPTNVIGAVRGGLARPIAFTNPIWIDKDGDGKCKPPLLPSDMPPRPLGFTSGQEESELRWQPAPDAALLHAPLDCEPDAYRQWLERTTGQK